jgi:hypothetical protein
MRHKISSAVSDLVRLRESWLIANNDPPPEHARRETPIFMARTHLPVAENSDGSFSLFKPCLETRYAAAEPASDGGYDLILYQNYEFDDGLFDSRAVILARSLDYAQSITILASLIQGWKNHPAGYKAPAPD